jgi:hypothetical protein
MKNILVTTPKSESKNAILEANDCLNSGGGYYFRSMAKKPKDLFPGSKVFYVDNEYIRGFAVVEKIEKNEMICSTTGRSFGTNWNVLMRADSWKWIKPILHKGFQGYRYFDREVEIVGNWKDKMPCVD